MKQLFNWKFDFYFLGAFIFSMTPSCIEEIEDIEPRFEKVIGRELDSFGHVEMELANGNLVVAGEIYRPKFDDTGVEAVPAITLLDADGNFLLRRIYPVDSLFYVDVDGPWPVRVDQHGFVQNVIQLDDGNFRAIVIAEFDEWWGPNYVTLLLSLDPQFNLIAMRDITYPNPPRWRVASALFKFEDGNLGVVFWRDYNYYNSEIGVSTSILKMTINGDAIIYKRYPIIEPEQNVNYQLYEPIFEPNGDLLLCGTTLDLRPFLEVDSLELLRVASGDFSVEKTVSWGVGGEQHFGLALFPVPEGYAFIKKYDDNKVNPEFFDFKLGVNIFDRNLNFVREVRFDIPVESNRGCIQASDGGILCLIAQSDDEGNKYTLLIKLDNAGYELWRRYFDAEPQYGGLVETKDGSLIISMVRAFNGQREKMIIKKIGPNCEGI